MLEKIEGVILAGGGGIHEKGAPDTGPNKALVEINGRIMLDYVVEALRGAGIERIAVVGPGELEQYCTTAGLVLGPPGATPLASLASGLETLRNCRGESGDWVVVGTGDIPLLTTAAIRDFLNRCHQEEEADFYYPVIKRETAESAFPGVRRTYARLREGYFTGGNLFLIRKSVIAGLLPKAEGLIKYRKDPVKMVRLVGIGLLIRYLLGILTIPWAERRVSRMFGARGKAVISSYPEIGVDVDKPSDLELAQKRLAGC